jgi:hypothetical protein
VTAEDEGNRSDAELRAVQAALRAYEAARKSWPADQRQQMEAEFGALLIQLITIGDQLHLDVFKEADKFLQRIKQPR